MFVNKDIFIKAAASVILHNNCYAYVNLASKKNHKNVFLASYDLNDWFDCGHEVWLSMG